MDGIPQQIIFHLSTSQAECVHRSQQQQQPNKQLILEAMIINKAQTPDLNVTEYYK